MTGDHEQEAHGRPVAMSFEHVTLDGPPLGSKIDAYTDTTVWL
jgi:hypothetical protein